MKVWNCLPKEVSERLVGLSDVREIRIRNGMDVKVDVGGQWYSLSQKGLVPAKSGGSILSEDCDSIVRRVCNNSVYAYEKMLSKGYFTLEDGVRVGVCGQLAVESSVFQRYTSLCFRIPHIVHCVDERTYLRCRQGSVVVIGPPCSGKTTFLRDLAMQLAKESNVLVVDERGEFFFDKEAEARSGCDILKWSSKQYAFECGIRAMSPQWIVCDEISSDDISFVTLSVNSGINVACSAHGRSVEEFDQKFHLAHLFSTAVILEHVGSKYSIFDLKTAHYDKKLQNIE